MNLEESFLRKLVNEKRTVFKMIERPEPRYFYQKSEDKYNYIKERLYFMKNYYLEVLGIQDFEKITHVSSNYFYMYGILISTNGQKFSNENVYLFNNIDGSNDVIVKLNLEYTNKFSIFRGQVVAIKGKNNGNNEIIVDNIHCLPTIDTNVCESKYNCNVYVVNMMDLAHLDALLNTEADIYIFNGILYKDLKEYRAILYKIDGFILKSSFSKDNKLKSSKSKKKAIIIPHQNEPNNISIFPQPSNKMEYTNLTFVSNPSEFYINDMLFSVTTFDAFSEIKSDILLQNKGLEKQVDSCNDYLWKFDFDTIICYNMVFQRSFLPVMPSKYNVLYDHELLKMSIAPNFYIFPSKSDRFVKEIGPTKVINTGKSFGIFEISISSGESNIKFVD